MQLISFSESFLLILNNNNNNNNRLREVVLSMRPAQSEWIEIFKKWYSYAPPYDIMI